MPSLTPSQAPGEGPARKSLSAIPKSWTFTSRLTPDPLFPTPLSSHQTPRELILPRAVRSALYTFVRPAVAKDPELLGVSAAALRDLGIAGAEAKTDEFLQTVAGNRLWEWDEAEAVAEKEKYKKPDSGEYDEQQYRAEAKKSGYPWAQCYGGYQFGQWAGQLGDGRAISLFETTPPPPAQDSKTRQNDYRPDDVPLRYELQLKGAGLTPYSRFADGKAVLRSSIREWVVSEYLHALGIPTTRALSLTLLPHERVHRETIEPGAIVLRFAQSWVRFGTFDLPRARGDRDLLRKLANYVAEEVFGGWEFLPPRVPDAKGTKAPNEANIALGEESNGNERMRLGKFELQGPEGMEENRYTRLYREIARRNAKTVARWQAYGFMNGVLNTDNTSVYGLSIDFGPFAFMDTFDPKYTPNHDDHLLRYCFRNQPTVIWWNLVRLGEALGELMGAGPGVDEKAFVESGVENEEAAAPLIKRAEGLIERCGEEYKAVFMAEYKQVMSKRLGLRMRKEEDFEVLFSELLDWMEELETDFHLTFRRLSELKVKDLETAEQRKEKAGVFFNPEGVTGVTREQEARKRIGEWLGRWRERIIEDWGKDGMVDEGAEEERIKEMKKVNPSFVPRGWVLDEVIRRVQHEGERDVLRRVMHMAVHPFEDTWNGKTFEEEKYEGNEEEEKKWTGDVPRSERGMMCSCSS